MAAHLAHDPKAGAHFVRLRIPVSDQDTVAFLQAQDNASVSIRLLIREFMAEHGAIDALSTPVTLSPKRGRPKQTVLDTVDASLFTPADSSEGEVKDEDTQKPTEKKAKKKKEPVVQPPSLETVDSDDEEDEDIDIPDIVPQVKKNTEKPSALTSDDLFDYQD